jgi:protein arginine N-methyltransferase 7
MINDLPRNAFYKTALDLAVRPGCTVLEIGTGSGLLSMLAARAGPDHV